MFWTHVTIKYAHKKCIFEIIVVEISFWREKSNVTISTRDNTYDFINFIDLDDSQTRKFVSFILKYRI